MKRTLITLTILAASSLLLASNSFAGKLSKLDACIQKDSGDECTYTNSKGIVRNGICKVKVKNHQVICAANQ